MNIILHIFPNNYDVKNLINEFTEYRNFSLTRLGDELNINWEGT